VLEQIGKTIAGGSVDVMLHNLAVADRWVEAVDALASVRAAGPKGAISREESD
jgi:hypothetical protein